MDGDMVHDISSPCTTASKLSAIDTETLGILKLCGIGRLLKRVQKTSLSRSWGVRYGLRRVRGNGGGSLRLQVEFVRLE